MKKLALIAAAVSLLTTLSVHASCPNLKSVTYNCAELGDKRQCQWSAPWWEGYQGDAEAGEHPTQFLLAFWRAVNDPEMGSVVCFYLDKHGDLVELSQNSWGGVAKPVSDLWKDGDWPASAKTARYGATGKVCNSSTTECVFNYGS